MAITEKIVFEATIVQHKGMNAAYVEFPYDVQKLFGTRGQVKIRAELDGKITYRGSLANMGAGCHVLGLTKEIRNQLGKGFGDTVAVTLEKDTEERNVEIPADISVILNQNPDYRSFFDSLSFTNRKEYIRWIESAKKEETRSNRLTQLQLRLERHLKFSDKLP